MLSEVTFLMKSQNLKKKKSFIIEVLKLKQFDYIEIQYRANIQSTANNS